jgi:hypothetical protein
MQPTTWHRPSVQGRLSAAQSAFCVHTRAQSAVAAQPPAGPQAVQTRLGTKPALHESDAIVHRPASQTAALLRHGSAKHCTPGVGHFGSGSPGPSARQSQPVQVNEKVLQSAFVRHCGGGGGSQICCVQAPPRGAQMPQLSLQQNSPAWQTFGPQRSPDGLGSQVP